MQSSCKSRIKFIESPRVQENKARELKSQGIKLDLEHHVHHTTAPRKQSLVAARHNKQNWNSPQAALVKVLPTVYKKCQLKV